MERRLNVVLTVLALLISFYAMYLQTQVQAAEFKAHVAEELMERSQDAVVNSEVTQR